MSRPGAAGCSAACLSPALSLAWAERAREPLALRAELGGHGPRVLPWAKTRLRPSPYRPTPLPLAPRVSPSPPLSVFALSDAIASAVVTKRATSAKGAHGTQHVAGELREWGSEVGGKDRIAFRSARS
jgi:hypothetical protein